MAPQNYKDLNLNARKLINEGFNYGHLRIECGLGGMLNGMVQYSNESKHGITSGTMTHKWPQYGIVFENKLLWDVSGKSEERQLSVLSEMKINQQFTKGLQLSFQTSFMPFISKKSSLMSLSKQTDTSITSALIHFDLAGTLLSLSHVVRIGEGGWNVGVKWEQSNAASLIQKSILFPLSFTLSYLSPHLQTTLSISNQTEFEVSIHRRVSDKVRVASILDWSALTNQANLVLAGKMKTHYGTLRLKGNKSCQLSASCHFVVTRQISMLLSTQLQLNPSSHLHHKFGLGFKLKL